VAPKTRLVINDGDAQQEIVSSELIRLEAEMFEADWAGAKERLGREPHLDEAGRTAPQRRADALVEMATRSKSNPGRRPAS